MSSRTEEQKQYYHNNKKRVRTNRLKLRLKKGPGVENVRLQTIQEYGLEDFAEEHGWDINDISVNKIEAQVSRGVNEQITQKVEKRLAEYDKEIKKLMEQKRKQLQNWTQNRPLKEGKLTLKDAVERLGHVDLYAESTRLGHQKRLENMFKHILKDKGDDVVGTFNDYPDVIKKIENATLWSGKDKGKPYKDLSHFFNMPVTMYNNILEFRSGLSHQAYLKYKTAFQIEKNKGADRLREIKIKAEYPDIQELHLCRKYYANDAPGSIWHLISSLYTLTPSVRGDYGCVHLITKLNKRKNDGIHNFYDVEKGEFILNTYKTSKRYGTLTYKYNKKLVDVINLWLRMSGNKKYLISKHNYNKSSTKEELPLDCDTIGHAGAVNKLVSDSFNFYMKKDEGEKSIGIRVIRIIWVKELEKIKDVKKRTELARLMGHSLEIAKNVYLRGTEGLAKESSAELKKYKDYGEKGFPWTEKQVMKGIDKRFEYS